MQKTKIIFTIIIYNFILFIFCTQLDELKIEELDNTVILKNLTTSSYVLIHQLDRISSDPKSNLINSFYVRTLSFSKRYSVFNYSYFDDLIRIDSIQDNDLKELNSIFIKENLTESFDQVYEFLYVGDIFLFKDKYNFISLNSDYRTKINFYSLEKKDGKKN